ncbi:cryptococcal mannosyltransferase 1-domain-containing protein [Mycena rebaudengoi]|nr:cryptococcal mannosyltransferase 1-domain-containing protein [Mycena rebaudengoi]
MLKTYEHPGDHRYKQDVEKAISLPRREGYHNGDKIFIAAMFYDNSAVLPYWITEITKFICYVGPDNVFVSIVESNSHDTTPQLLEDFDATLKLMGVARRILTHDTSIKKPDDMKTATPRIEFLSSVRNLVMQPLVERGGYDRVIFSNDIFIEAESVVELLKTRNGEYDFVCGLDFGSWALYDQWVIRDRLGRIISTVWPFFFEDTGTGPVKQDEPATVFACWNGIVAFNPELFVPIPLRIPGRLSTSPLSRPLAPSHPAFPQSPDLTPAQTPPLRFRASIDREECFSSESLLLPYDMRRQFDMQNMYVNPRVINAYEWKYYLWFKYITRHWAVRWFIDRFENGFNLQYSITKLVVGGGDRIFRWDGGECHPGFPS